MNRAYETDQYLAQIRDIIVQNLELYAVKVYLFGSRVNESVRTGSDCDVGIDPLQDLPVGLLSKLREDLEESNIPYVVELIDLSQVEEEFAQKIREQGLFWIGFG